MASREAITVAVTGASGSMYGIRLIEKLVAAQQQVYVLFSKTAHVVVATETELQLPTQPESLTAALTEHTGAAAGQLTVFGREQWYAPVASGSNAPRAMVIVPCSTGTLSAVATGASNNLIERAADVALKERRQLILVPREAPYSAIHLQNMLTLTQMGAVVLPASPGFYHKPQTIDDLIDFVVARILDHLHITHNVGRRWGE